MSQRVIVSSKVKSQDGAEAKASLNRANELLAVDPKPDDLTMARMKRR